LSEGQFIKSKKDKKDWFKYGCIYPLTAYIIFTAIFSFILYFFASYKFITFKHKYDYLWLGAVFASFVWIVPLFRRIIIYFIRKEFEE